MSRDRALRKGENLGQKARHCGNAKCMPEGRAACRQTVCQKAAVKAIHMQALHAAGKLYCLYLQCNVDHAACVSLAQHASDENVRHWEGIMIIFGRLVMCTCLFASNIS